MALRAILADSANPRLSDSVLAASLTDLDVRLADIVGDGITDDGANLNAFFAANPGRVIVIPQGFNIRTTVPIDPTAGITVRGYGATLINDCPGTGDRLLRIIGVSNVTIEGLELDGDKASFAAATEHRHNLALINADNITLRDVYSHDAKGDGIYVGDDNNSANYCTNVTLEGCRTPANHRNGLSVVAVDGFSASDCWFTDQSGTNPQAGADVEPNNAAGVCNDVKFVNCTFTGNVGCGASVALHMAPTARQGSISFTNCEMGDNTDTVLGAGMRIRNPNDVRVVACQMRGNAAEGVYIDSQGSFVGGGVTIVGCNISENGLEGIDVTGVVDDINLSVIGCEIVDNSQATPNAVDGINITPTAVSANYQIIGSRFDGVSQRYGLRTGSNARKVTILGNTYGTMGTGTVSLSDEQGSRFRQEWDGSMFSHTTAATIVQRFRENADVNDRLLIRTDGEVRWGDGTIAPDVNLFRNGVDQLRTADTFVAAKLWTLGELEIDGAFNHDGTTVGFYGVAPVTRAASPGTASGTDAAVINAIITALRNLGLVT